MQAFQWILEKSGKKPIIWAAWGTNIERRKYLKEKSGCKVRTLYLRKQKGYLMISTMAQRFHLLLFL